MATLAMLLPPILPAQTAYYRHAVFDNSQQPDYYWNSSAVATAPSTLEQQNWRLPVETKNFLSPPNALRLHWRSEPDGGWDAEIHLVNFRNRFPELSGQTLYLWLYAPQGIAAADLPDLVLSDAREGLQVATFPGSFTAAEPLGKYAGDLPAGQWVQVRIPLMTLHSASVYAFDPARLQSVIFHQGRADDADHTLIVDQVRVDEGVLASPSNERGTPLTRSVTITPPAKEPDHRSDDLCVLLSSASIVTRKEPGTSRTSTPESILPMTMMPGLGISSPSSR